jgi:DNA-binding FadR family transcriptional regulator
MRREPLFFHPYLSRRASDEIAENIRKAVFSKRLKKGTRLPSERSLAKEFQVGRLSVREALRSLETRGIIKIRKGSSGGPYIDAADLKKTASIVMDNLEIEGVMGEEIAAARMILAKAVIELAVENATPEDLEDISKYINESKTVVNHDNLYELVSRLIDFHILLAKASHNTPLIMFTAILMEWARRRLKSWFPKVEEQLEIFKFHQQIFDSIKLKNAALASRLMDNYIARINERLKRLELY